MMSSPCGVDGSDNTKRSCNLSYVIPTHVNGETPDVADAPLDVWQWVAGQA